LEVVGNISFEVLVLQEYRLFYIQKHCLPQQLAPVYLQRLLSKSLSIVLKGFNSDIPLNSPFCPFSNSKKYFWSHLTPSKCTPKHYSSSNITLWIADVIRMKFFIMLMPYSVLSSSFGTHFDTYLICEYIYFPVLYSHMSMTPCKLQTLFPILFL